MIDARSITGSWITGMHQKLGGDQARGAGARKAEKKKKKQQETKSRERTD